MNREQKVQLWLLLAIFALSFSMGLVSCVGQEYEPKPEPEGVVLVLPEETHTEFGPRVDSGTLTISGDGTDYFETSGTIEITEGARAYATWTVDSHPTYTYDPKMCDLTINHQSEDCGIAFSDGKVMGIWKGQEVWSHPWPPLSPYRNEEEIKALEKELERARTDAEINGTMTDRFLKTCDEVEAAAKDVEAALKKLRKNQEEQEEFWENRGEGRR